jgi:hypothetical protein
MNEPRSGPNRMLETVADRDQRLAGTLVRLAGSLVSSVDVTELLDDLIHSCVDLLDVAAAGLLLADQGGALRVRAASSEQSGLLELFEIQREEGPGLDCYRTQSRVAATDPGDQASRWPAFARAARDQGFGPVYALPMQTRNNTIGALDLFTEPGERLTETQLDIGQALASVATIAILQHRARRADQLLVRQLQTALDSRIVIEQAKGFLASYADTDTDTAFQLLRRYARSNSAPLSATADDLVNGNLHPSRIHSMTRRPDGNGPSSRTQARESTPAARSVAQPPAHRPAAAQPAAPQPRSPRSAAPQPRSSPSAAAQPRGPQPAAPQPRSPQPAAPQPRTPGARRPQGA